MVHFGIIILIKYAPASILSLLSPFDVYSNLE